MKKYGVICYAVHDKDIASCDWFDDYESAKSFLEEDAQSTYEDESKDDDPDAELLIDGDFASLTSYEGEYEWTWHIVSHS